MIINDKNLRITDSIEISQEILKFGKGILSNQQIQFADLLSEDIIKPANREHAINTLRNIVGVKPKRPLYYVNHELTQLPDWSRNMVRYLGDYIDQLIKCIAVDKLGAKTYDSRSLGSNILSLRNKDILPQELLDELTTYNNVFYVPAKHDFKVENRAHRFTCKEAIYACFITLQIANELLTKSEQARAYAEQKTHEYYI